MNAQIRRSQSRHKSYIDYCYSPLHRGYITVKIAKKHKCYCKEYVDEEGNKIIGDCNCLKRLEHPYWESRVQSKMARKAIKFAKKFSNNNINSQEIWDLCKKLNWNEEQIMNELKSLLEQ